MERAATAALRSCLRSSTPSVRVARCQIGDIKASRSVCIAATICPARTLSATSASSSTLPQLSPPTTSRMPRRIYSSESSIQGRIGKGESGVADEAARAAGVLVAPQHLDEKEKKIWEMLIKELQPSSLEVQDISGGCGSMYGIDVVSERFRGLSMLKQQRLVNEVLGEEIKGWHGVQLKTRAP